MRAMSNPLNLVDVAESALFELLSPLFGDLAKSGLVSLDPVLSSGNLDE